MTCTIEQLEEFRLAQEIRRILKVGNGYEGSGYRSPLACAPARRGKEGYEVANHGLRRKRYLQLH